MSDEFISNFQIQKEIRKVLECYKGVFSVNFDPRKLKDSGIFQIELGGVPKDNALEIWNDK